MSLLHADPFQRPYWRHERVLNMRAAVPPQRCTRNDDRWIQEYKSFLTEWEHGDVARQKLLQANPGLFYAFKIHDLRAVEPEVALLTEARLLAGMSYAAIARNIKTIAETVEWYEKLFFNVSDRLQHHDWIVRTILLPTYDQCVGLGDIKSTAKSRKKTNVPSTSIRPHLDMTLKFFAYFGGPLVCDFMITGFQRRHKLTNPNDLTKYISQQFALQLQRRSAQAAITFEANSFNVMELFNAHTRLIELYQNSKNPEENKNEFEQHVSALLSELHWTSGRAGAQRYAGQAIGEYDQSAIELSADEAVEVGLGHRSTTADCDLPVNVFSNRAPS